MMLAAASDLLLPINFPIAALSRWPESVIASPGQPRGAGQGVGSALMAFLLDTARARGVPGLRSHVSLTAQPLFMRHGFRVDARQTVYVRGVAFENARMLLALG